MKFPLGTILALLAATFILATLLFPAVTICLDPGTKSQAKNDVNQLAVAIKAYEVEYGHLPGTNRGVVGKELMDTLMGGNPLNLNPRQIVFFEPRTAKNGKGGVTPEGIFVDPWGGPYQIAFASGTNNIVTNAGPEGVDVHQRVAVWNNPAAGKFPWFSDQATLQGQRAVTSWQ